MISKCSAARRAAKKSRAESIARSVVTAGPPLSVLRIVVVAFMASPGQKGKVAVNIRSLPLSDPYDAEVEGNCVKAGQRLCGPPGMPRPGRPGAWRAWRG